MFCILYFYFIFIPHTQSGEWNIAFHNYYEKIMCKKYRIVPGNTRCLINAGFISSSSAVCWLHSISFSSSKNLAKD